MIFANDFLKTNDVNINYPGLFSVQEIGQYFRFPEHSILHSISGASAIEFDVTKNGNLDNIKIINSLGLKITNGFRYRLPFKFEN